MKDKIAVQMFTLRDYTKTEKDFAESLEKISRIGYKAVQLSAVGCMNGENPAVSAEQARKMLDDNGLACIATHRSWDALQQQVEAEIAFHQTLGCTYAAVGGIPAKTYETSYDGYRRWLDDARTVIANLKAAGIRFGHHNHAKEFYRPERHGATLEDILIDEGGADLMLELDLYWIAHAGVNPQRILERCQGRVPVIHLKDKEAQADTNDCRIAPIGEGGMDWPHILRTCEDAGVDWYAIEQDQCYRDPFDCLRSSYEYFENVKLADA